MICCPSAVNKCPFKRTSVPYLVRNVWYLVTSYSVPLERIVWLLILSLWALESASKISIIYVCIVQCTPSAACQMVVSGDQLSPVPPQPRLLLLPWPGIRNVQSIVGYMIMKVKRQPARNSCSQTGPPPARSPATQVASSPHYTAAKETQSIQL